MTPNESSPEDYTATSPALRLNSTCGTCIMAAAEATAHLAGRVAWEENAPVTSPTTPREADFLASTGMSPSLSPE